MESSKVPLQRNYDYLSSSRLIFKKNGTNYSDLKVTIYVPLKGIVSVISSDRPVLEKRVQFTTVPFKSLSGQRCC